MIIGIVLILISFIHWLLPYTLWNLTISTSLFMIGNILFFDAVVYKFTNTSLIKTTFQSQNTAIRLLGCLFLFVVFLELYAHWLGKYWYFPHMSVVFYFFVEIPLLILYSFYILETYQGIKILCTRIWMHKDAHKQMVINHTLPLFILSTVVFLSGTYYLVWQRRNDTLLQFLSIDAVPKTPNSEINLMVLILLATSLWLLIEYMLFKKTGKFCLLSFFHGNYIPLLSVFIAGIASAFFYEIFNAPGGFWRYGNIPFSEYNLLGIPALVFLGWPFQYLILIPLYELFVSKKS